MTGNAMWLNTNDAAAELGLVARSLCRMINEGELPAYRFGRVIRIKREDIDALVERSRIEPGTIDHLDRSGSRNDREAAEPEPDDD